eukprot:357308-Chlamydomonas_euryale.AAC.12
MRETRRGLVPSNEPRTSCMAPDAVCRRRCGLGSPGNLRAASAWAPSARADAKEGLLLALAFATRGRENGARPSCFARCAAAAAAGHARIRVRPGLHGHAGERSRAASAGRRSGTCRGAETWVLRRMCARMHVQDSAQRFEG